MKKQLTRITPLNAGLVLGCLQGLLALVFVIPFMLVAAAVLAFTPFHHLDHGTSLFGIAIPAGVSIALMVFIPLFYAVMGFVIGVIAALIYNLIAKLTGGLEFEVRELPPQL